MTAALPSLAGLSAEARDLLSLCARARVDERPGRHKAAQTRRPKAQPIIPIAKAQGVSRSDIVERCTKWWGESRWTMDLVTRVVDELVARGILTRCVNGIRFADAWGPMMAAMLGSDHERIDGAFARVVEPAHLSHRVSAGMVHIGAASLRLDWVPSHAPLRIDLLQELDDIATVVAEMRAAVAAAGAAS